MPSEISKRLQHDSSVDGEAQGTVFPLTVNLQQNTVRIICFVFFVKVHISAGAPSLREPPSDSFL